MHTSQKLVALFVAAACTVSCGVKKEEVEKGLIDKCVKTVTYSSPEVVAAHPDEVQNYCQCSADKIFEKYTPKEVKKIQELGETSVQNAEMWATAHSCLDEFFDKVNE